MPRSTTANAFRMIDHLSLTATRLSAYIPPVAVNPAAGIGVPNEVTRGHQRKLCDFFVAHAPYGGLGGKVERLAGHLAGTPIPFSLSPDWRRASGSNTDKGISMTTTLEARDARTVARALAILERAFSHPDRPTLADPDTAKHYAQLRLGGLDREQMIAMWLDSQHRLIQVEILSTGTVTETVVYPREVVRSALHFGACSVIFAHNHPSGNSRPSLADIGLTNTLKAALSLIDVKTLDHLIVTASHVLSLAAMGEI